MSTFGTLLRTTTFGESHGDAVGCILDGILPGLEINEQKIQNQLNRRRPGQSLITTQRNETDKIKILSGVENGITLGTPIALLIMNEDKKKFDYADTKLIPRPGHADYTYQMKYGIRSQSGGGRSSARETVARVAAGVIAETWLIRDYNIEIVAWITSVGNIRLPFEISEKFEISPPTRDQIDHLGSVKLLKNGSFIDAFGKIYTKNSQNNSLESSDTDVGKETANNDDTISNLMTRCPDPETAAKIAALIETIRQEQDSIGGIVTCVIKNCPVALGEPCFSKIEAELSKAMMSIPAVKGFELGKGFEGVTLKGSEYNDSFIPSNIETNSNNKKLLHLSSNNSGGTLGGITTGANIVFRLVVKPVSSIGLPQKTSDFNGVMQKLIIKGRHDPCVLPRIPAIVESMAALTIADMALIQRARICQKEGLITLN